MKGRKMTRLLAILAATLMTVTLISSYSAKAANYADDKQATAPTGVTFNKVLSLPDDSEVPECGFGFDISAGTEKLASASGEIDIFAGIISGNYPSASDAIYAAGAAKDTTLAVGAITASCTRQVNVNFGDIKFPEPGVYRYIITERVAHKTSTEDYTNVGVGPDTNKIVMDVYVFDTAGSLSASAVTFQKVADESAATNPTTAAATGEKTAAFINTYPTNTLKISKTVAGNQGSKDEYFKFTIKLENNGSVTVPDNSLFGVSGQDKTPTSNTANKYTDMSSNNITNNILTGAQLKAGYDIYLQHGQTVIISGIIENCKFTVEEDPDTYDVTTTFKTDETTPVDQTDTNDADEIVSGTLEKSSIVTFTNTKNGVIPTGVILKATGLIVVGLIVIIGVVFFGVRSKRRYEED